MTYVQIKWFIVLLGCWCGIVFFGVSAILQDFSSGVREIRRDISDAAQVCRPEPVRRNVLRETEVDHRCGAFGENCRLHSVNRYNDEMITYSCVCR